jgi:hypothetical protein
MSGKSRVYVASSWRNEYHPDVVLICKAAGADVYDFRNPSDSGLPEVSLREGFRWHDIDPGWKEWGPEAYRHRLKHPVAQQGFAQDMAGLRWADLVLLVLPCGRSAHLELGWAAGAGKRTAVYFHTGVQCEPELMNLLADEILVGVDELWRYLRALPPQEALAADEVVEALQALRAASRRSRGES